MPDTAAEVAGRCSAAGVVETHHDSAQSPIEPDAAVELTQDQGPEVDSEVAAVAKSSAVAAGIAVVAGIAAAAGIAVEVSSYTVCCAAVV